MQMFSCRCAPWLFKRKGVKVVFVVFNLNLRVCKKSVRSSISLDSVCSTFCQPLWEYRSAMSSA